MFAVEDVLVFGYVLAFSCEGCFVGAEGVGFEESRVGGDGVALF